MELYPIFLSLHNILRWVVVILAVLALVRAYLGWVGKRAWTPVDRRAGLLFGISLDLQLLIGMVLYLFLSPLTRAAFANFSGAMENPDMRFYALEHIFYMILAVIFAHVGSIASKRAQGSERKHRAAAIWYTLAVIVIVIAIPWTRPIFRLPF
jgi:hypothetical protein